MIYFDGAEGGMRYAELVRTEGNMFRAMSDKELTDLRNLLLHMVTEFEWDAEDRSYLQEILRDAEEHLECREFRAQLAAHAVEIGETEDAVLERFVDFLLTEDDDLD